MPVRLQLGFYLHQYAFLQFGNYSVPCRQVAARQSDAYQRLALMLHALLQMLLVEVGLMIRLDLDARGIQRFWPLNLHLVGCQTEALVY